MEIVDSDHLIVAEMLMISSAVEDVVEKYGIKLPALNLSTINTFIEKLKTFPQSTVKTTINQSVDAYVKLNSRLTKYAY